MIETQTGRNKDSTENFSSPGWLRHIVFKRFFHGQSTGVASPSRLRLMVSIYLRGICSEVCVTLEKAGREQIFHRTALRL